MACFLCCLVQVYSWRNKAARRLRKVGRSLLHLGPSAEAQ
jgi:hypothetical protein